MTLNKNTARATLFQIVILLILIAVLLFAFKNKIASLYSTGDIMLISLVLNGLILALFLLGMFRMVIMLLRYVNEHQTLLKLVKYLQEDAADPVARLSSDAISVQRFKYVHWINQQGSNINQAALAATLNASENSRLTLIRFVHSVLILAGVFGTVVSLSLALVGASTLLGSPDDTREMGAIIGGMSSALSTTMTAIVCFIIYAYFYMRMNDARVQLLSGVEDATSLYILPKISHSEESLIRHVANLTLALSKSADRISQVEEQFIKAGSNLEHAVEELRSGIRDASMDEMMNLIREGFRLPPPVEKQVEATDETEAEVEPVKRRGFRL